MRRVNLFFKTLILILISLPAVAGGPIPFMFFPIRMGPPDPTSFLSFQDSTTSIYLTWVSGGGTTTNFRIAYQTGNTAPSSCSTATMITSATIAGATQYTVTGLTINTTYSFRLCAIDAAAPINESTGIGTTISTPTATPIYRSVGPANTLSLAAGGSNALSVAGSIATFGTALATKIGVGDAIQYDTDANAVEDKIVFIQGRISSTKFLVKTAAGAVPTAVATTQSWKIFRSYTSLSDAMGGLENTGILLALRDFDTGTWKGITATAQTRYFTCYSDAADTIATTVSGFTTSANNWVTIYTPYKTTEVGVSQRHSGIWTASGYVLSNAVANSDTLAIDNAYVQITGLQVKSTANSSFATVITYGSSVAIPAGTKSEISNNIIWHDYTTATDTQGIYFFSSVNETPILYIVNNIIYSTLGTTLDAIVIDHGTAYVYNNTIYKVRDGINRINAVGTGIVTAINNIVQTCAVTCYNSTSNSWAAGTNYNISSSTSITTGANNKISTTVTFVNAAGFDLHLGAGDTAAKDAGTNLSADPNYPVINDIDMQSRTGAWDIGADSL